MASPFVSRAKLYVGHTTMQNVSPLSFSHKISYSDSGFISLFGNFTIRTIVSPTLYSLLPLHFTSPQTKPCGCQHHPLHGRAFTTRTSTIASEAATSKQKASFPLHQHCRYYYRRHHVEQPLRQPGHSIPMGMLLHTIFHNIFESRQR